MELGEKIAKIRKDNKLTQEDFAEKYNITRQTVSSWENSKSYPDLDILAKISDDYDISLDVLLKEDKKVIENISKSQNDIKKYKKILIVICIIIGVLILIISSYTIYYYHTKNKLESKFETTLQDNGFTKNKSGYYYDGYYSYRYNEKTEFSVPNQKIPNILDFHPYFYNSYLYCYIQNEDGTYIEGIWVEYDNYHFTLYDNDGIASIKLSSIKDNENSISKLSIQLKMNENELNELINKANDLYKQFYK